PPEVVRAEEVRRVGRPQPRRKVRGVRIERYGCHEPNRERGVGGPSPGEERRQQRERREEREDEEAPADARAPHASSASTMRGSARAERTSVPSVATTTATPDASVRPRTVGRSRAKTESARSWPVPGTAKTLSTRTEPATSCGTS